MPARAAPTPYATPNITLAAERLGFLTGLDSRYVEGRSQPFSAKAQELSKVVEGFGFNGTFQWGGRWSGQQGEGRMTGLFVNGDESIQITANQVLVHARDRTFTDPGRAASEYEVLGIHYNNGNRMLSPADLLASLPPAVVADSAADQLAKALTSGSLDLSGLVNGYERSNGFQREGRMARHSDGSWIYHGDQQQTVVGFTDPATLDTVVVYPLRKPTVLPAPEPVPTPPPPAPPKPKPSIARVNLDDAMVDAAKAPVVELQPVLAQTPPEAAKVDAGSVVEWGAPSPARAVKERPFEGQLRAVLGAGVDLEQVQSLLKSHEVTVRDSAIDRLGGFADAESALGQAWRDALPELTQSLLAGHDEAARAAALPVVERLLRPRTLPEGLQLEPMSLVEARAKMPRVANLLEGVKAELSTKVSSPGHEAFDVLAFAERRATEVLDATLREQLQSLQGNERLALYAAGRRLVADVVEWAESL